MSWGERSCTQFGSCTHGPTMSSCNVNCQFYVWNGKTKPDSEKAKTMPMTPEQVRKKTAQMKEWYGPNGTTAKHPIFPNVPRYEP